MPTRARRPSSFRPFVPRRSSTNTHAFLSTHPLAQFNVLRSMCSCWAGWKLVGSGKGWVAESWGCIRHCLWDGVPFRAGQVSVSQAPVRETTDSRVHLTILFYGERLFYRWSPMRISQWLCVLGAGMHALFETGRL